MPYVYPCSTDDSGFTWCEGPSGWINSVADIVPYTWGQYPAVYMPATVDSDGDVIDTDPVQLCYECARAGFMDLGPDETYVIESTDGVESNGVSCDGCHAWIRHPYCRDCGDSWEDAADKDLGYYVNENTDEVICGKCLAKARLAYRAAVAGQLIQQTRNHYWSIVSTPDGPNRYHVHNVRITDAPYSLRPALALDGVTSAIHDNSTFRFEQRGVDWFRYVLPSARAGYGAYVYRRPDTIG